MPPSGTSRATLPSLAERKPVGRRGEAPDDRLRRHHLASREDADRGRAARAAQGHRPAYVDGFRDHVIFSLAMGTGLREHELLALDVGRRVRRRRTRQTPCRPARVQAFREETRHRRCCCPTPCAPSSSGSSRRASAQGRPSPDAGLREPPPDDGSRRASSGTSSRSGGARRLRTPRGVSRCATTPAAPSTASRGPPAHAEVRATKSVVTTSIYTHPTDDGCSGRSRGSSAEPARATDPLAEQNRTRASARFPCSVLGFESRGCSVSQN